VTSGESPASWAGSGSVADAPSWSSAIPRQAPPPGVEMPVTVGAPAFGPPPGWQPPPGGAAYDPRPYGPPMGQPAPYGYPFPPPAYGRPYPGQPWAPPVAPPVRRGSAGRWFAAVLSVLMICVSLAGGAVFAVAERNGALDTRASWQDGTAPADAPPAQNAPASEWRTWARRSVDDVVRGPGAALLAGDEKAYLAAVDPAKTSLIAEHKRRFDVLRAMGLGVWEQGLTGTFRAKGERSWTADIKILYCFGGKDCRSVQLVTRSQWTFRDDRLRMVDLDDSDPRWNGPRPWETDKLTVRTGKRVVLAATRFNAWRLPEAVAAAEAAAGVADAFGKWEDPPGKYVIFLAGPNDWKRWYGHEQPDWAAAWAVPVSSTVTEVVVRTQVVRQEDLRDLLTHELTHVTTLAGKRDGAGRSAWWLIEGVADYATLGKRPVREMDGFQPTRTFVQQRWDGDPAIEPPSVEASVEEAAARYGMAFLAVRRIADKYGRARMLTFFGRVVHDAQSLETAAKAALGASWSTVRTDVVRFIRSSTA
jgi:hypothetical protein